MARRTALVFTLALAAFTAPAVAQPPRETPAQPRGPRIDVVFAIDATGSMADEIQQVKQHLWSTANGILQGDPQPDVRFGLVVYRDRQDAEHTRVVPLTRDVDAIHRELMNLQATGGGDLAEDVDAALQLAVDEMNWSDTGARMVFLIGDAPAKSYGVDRAALLERARRAEITFHTVQASGMTPAGGALFAQIAQLTGGEAEILTYRQMIAHNGRQRLLLRRGTEVFMGRRPLREAERSLSFRELSSRNLIRPAPAAVARRAAPRRSRRRSVRGSAYRGGGRPSAAAPAAAPVEFSDSDIGGIVNREARRAAEAEGVSY
jgi:Mg-chelatase subunit ChlD